MLSFRRAVLTGLSAAALVPASAHAGPAGTPPYFDLSKLPLPTVTGKEIADSVAAFSTTYAHRVTGTPIQVNAGNELRDKAKALGYDAQIVDLPVSPSLAGTGLTTAVVATRKGTTHPDESLVFTAHYDNVPQTIDAAYDNGSGTIMLLALAKAFSTIPTNRTLVFAWYNGEEEGALASDVHAKAFAAEKKAVRGVFGFDMVGIGWPVASPTDTSCLCVWHGDEDDALQPLLEYINFGLLAFPNAPNLVELRGSNTRNSDESSWDTAGYTTLRWAGMKTAANYPAYHMPDDTMATIDRVAGGRTFFEQGLRNTLLSSYFAVLALDNEMPVARATARGTGPVSFDATSSSDPDGPVGSVTWDFGDGTSGSGPVTSHAYKRKGSYTATAHVSDGLWPAVRSAVTIPVKVTRGTTTKKKRTKRAKRRGARR